MINDRQYSLISYNISLSNAIQLELGYDVQQFLVEMKAATGNATAEHIMRPAKVITTGLVIVTYTHC